MELLPSTDIQPRPVGSPVPLTALQRHQWNRIAKSGTSLSDSRMCAVSIHLSGPLNVSFLQQCIKSVIQRHESLRTTITVVDDAPQQRINAELRDYFEFCDLSSIPMERRAQEAARLGQELMEKKIDIFVGPLFEAKLFKLYNHDHVLIVGLDHLVSDAASYTILHREILSLYHQGMHGRLLSLPPMTIQFPDYAVWQQNIYDGWLKDREPYWKQRLRGAPTLRLIADKDSRQKTEHPVFARLHFPFGKILSAKLREIAQREHVRLPLVVLTAYASMMSKWCNQQELVFSFVSHGRRGHPDLKNMIGLLAHVLYLRIAIDDHDNFLDVMKKTHLELDAAHRHSDARILELMPDVTDVRFNWLRANQIVRHPWDGDQTIKIRPFPIKVESPAPNILPFFTDTPSGVSLSVKYRTDLFTEGTIEKFGRSMRQVSERLANDPLARVNSVVLANC